MTKTSVLFCLSFICFLEIVQLTPVPFKNLSRYERNLIALECMEEVKINRVIVEKVLKTEILPRDNDKYKKYLACSYKKQGYLSADGKEMLYDNLYQFLERFYDGTDLQSLEHCKAIREEDEGELCFQNLDCILKGLRKIEMQKEVISNDIE